MRRLCDASEALAVLVRGGIYRASAGSRRALHGLADGHPAKPYGVGHEAAEVLLRRRIPHAAKQRRDQLVVDGRLDGDQEWPHRRHAARQVSTVTLHVGSGRSRCRRPAGITWSPLPEP